MPTCQNCGRHVTQDWVRVFGLGGEVYSCPDCGETAGDARERAGVGGGSA